MTRFGCEFCLTLVHVVKREESCTGVEQPDLDESFVQLLCTWSNESESCMRVE